MEPVGKKVEHFDTSVTTVTTKWNNKVGTVTLQWNTVTSQGTTVISQWCTVTAEWSNVTPHWSTVKTKRAL